MKTKSASLDTTDKGGSFFVTQPTQAVPRRPGTFFTFPEVGAGLAGLVIEG